MSTEKNATSNFTGKVTQLVESKLGGNWAELSRLSGISQSTLHKIQNGTEPRISTAKKIADALDASLDWLISGKGKPPIDKEIEATAKLLENLDESQRREILSCISEKQRLNELEEIVSKLTGTGN